MTGSGKRKWLNRSDGVGISQAPVAQSVEHWSYEPEVAGSIPAWRIFFLSVFFNQNVSASRRAPLASMVNKLRDSLQKYIKINSVRVLKMLLFSETKGEKS